jgi:cytoskeletal protein RodZ
MNTTTIVLIGLAGTILAWIAYFRFSHEVREFLLLVVMTVVIVMLLLVAVMVPVPWKNTRTGADPGTIAIGNIAPMATSTPELSTLTVEPTPPATATAASTPTAPATATAASTPTAPATATAASTPVPTAAGVETTIRAPAVNIRSAPSETSNIVGSVQQGDEVIVLGVFGDWYLIRLGTERAPGSTINTNQGWISQPLVNAPTQTVPAITPAP